MSVMTGVLAVAAPELAPSLRIYIKERAFFPYIVGVYLKAHFLDLLNYNSIATGSFMAAVMNALLDKSNYLYYVHNAAMIFTKLSISYTWQNHLLNDQHLK
ncbi:hypothetical protein ACJX0J_035579 [Zea mays]